MTSSLVGSEMCIRDSLCPLHDRNLACGNLKDDAVDRVLVCLALEGLKPCLLYTSDAADDM
eukprot:5309822-Prorocentrum_lima.AAC.1